MARYFFLKQKINAVIVNSSMRSHKIGDVEFAFYVYCEVKLLLVFEFTLATLNLCPKGDI